MKIPGDSEEASTLIALLFTIGGFLMAVLGTLLMPIAFLHTLGILLTFLGVPLCITGSLSIAMLCSSYSFNLGFLKKDDE